MAVVLIAISMGFKTIMGESLTGLANNFTNKISEQIDSIDESDTMDVKFYYNAGGNIVLHNVPQGITWKELAEISGQESGGKPYTYWNDFASEYGYNYVGIRWYNPPSGTFLLLMFNEERIPTGTQGEMILYPSSGDGVEPDDVISPDITYYVNSYWR